METVISHNPDHSLLSSEVMATFGKRINTSRDCLQLSEDIFRKTAVTINSNTLRRFFGLVKAEYPPSAGTINILARYCGFNSIEQLVRSRNRQTDGENPDADSLLDFFISIFHNVPTREYNDETFIGVVKEVVVFLNAHPQLADRFQKAVAKTRQGQDFYFEQFVNIDKLNLFYADGIRYYLNEKKNAEAQIFGHSLLALRAWLSEDQPELELHFHEVMKQRLSKLIHPFVSGRFYVTQLLYAHTLNQDVERILIDAQHTHNSLRPGKDHYRHFPCFEYVLAPILLLIGRDDEAMYYIEYAVRNYPARHPDIEEGQYQSLDLVRAMTLLRNGRREEAWDIYQEIKPSEFYFLTKTVNSIFHLMLRKELGKANPSFESELNSMIGDTGFERLRLLKKDGI